MYICYANYEVLLMQKVNELNKSRETGSYSYMDDGKGSIKGNRILVSCVPG